MSYFSETPDFDSTAETVMDNYANEFGERKFKKVLKKVMTSKQVIRLIHAYIANDIPIDPLKVLQLINQVPYFIFSKGQTQLLASTTVIKLWFEMTGKNTALASDKELKNMILFIIDETKPMNR